MIVLLGMGAGIALGYLLRRRQRLLALFDGGATALVYLLLFLLGAAVGGQRQLLVALDELGVQALLLSLGAVAGSLLLVAPLAPRLLPRREEARDEG